MIENIYVEDSISSNNNVKEIIKKTKAKNIIKCQSYKEIFNLKKQKSTNFILFKIKRSYCFSKYYNKI